MIANTTGTRNTVVGSETMIVSTIGTDNTSLGYRTLYASTSGSYNVAIGNNALGKLTKSYYNTAVGYNSLAEFLNGYSATGNAGITVDFGINTAVGANALRCLSTVSVVGAFANTAIGYNSGYFLSGSYNVAIGSYDCLPFRSQNNNIFVSDGQGTLRMIITGSNGNVGIGTTAPLQALQVGSVGAGSTNAPTAISLGASFSDTAGTNTKAKLRLYDNGAGVVNGLSISNLQLEYLAASSVSHVWYTGGAENMRIDANGKVGIGGTATPGEKLHVYNGNIQLNNTYGLIWSGLSGPTNGSRTSANLDHYDYGTWTPVFAGSSTAGTYTLTNTKAYYVRVGKLVVVSLYTEMTATSYSAGSGDWRITGLPYSSSSGIGIASVGKYSGLASNVATISGVVEEGNTYVDMYVTTANGAANAKAAINLYVGTSTKIAMTITFRVT